jgi:hypothetical protein
VGRSMCGWTGNGSLAPCPMRLNRPWKAFGTIGPAALSHEYERRGFVLTLQAPEARISSPRSGCVLGLPPPAFALALGPAGGRRSKILHADVGERLRLTALISPGGSSPFPCRSRAMILAAYSPRLRVQRSIENSMILPSSYSATNATRLLVISSRGVDRAVDERVGHLVLDPLHCAGADTKLDGNP